MEKPLEGYLEGPAIAPLASILRACGVAVLPTDTIYGFHCVISDLTPIDRIIRLKGRSKSSGLILLASSRRMVDSVVDKWPDGTKDILFSLWPAAVTAILPASRKIPVALRPDDKVAVRIPAMPALLALIEKIGGPIVSTSVNRSGRPPMNRIGEIRRAFPGLDAYISRRGPGSRSPSTVIDLTGDRVRIVRRGRSAGRAAKALGVD
jgi:L-threonylcarbamoyladenylate synthase